MINIKKFQHIYKAPPERGLLLLNSKGPQGLELRFYKRQQYNLFYFQKHCLHIWYNSRKRCSSGWSLMISWPEKCLILSTFGAIFKQLVTDIKDRMQNFPFRPTFSIPGCSIFKYKYYLNEIYLHGTVFQTWSLVIDIVTFP